MSRHVKHAEGVGWTIVVGLALSAAVAGGCRTCPCGGESDLQVRGAIEHYCVEQSGRLSRPRGPDLSFLPDRPARDPFAQFGWLPRGISRDATGRFRPQVLTLGTFAGEDRPGSTLAATAETQPAAAPTFTPPEGYWRKDLWHQMGYEAKQFGERDFWRGFKTSFWDVENALILTATMGASITIRGTGVDDTIRNRTHGSRAMGDMDETVQILGHPGTHFAATGVLWLTSALTKDMKQHEVAQALTQALAVNGVTTLALKAATNTRAPNGDHFAWPSGHTSSAFAAAAVLNEYYGPLVGIPSLALAGLVGYQRIDSRVHDFSDVVFGAMMGYVIGTSVARDGKAEFPELFGMKVIPYVDPETNASGLALLKQW